MTLTNLDSIVIARNLTNKSKIVTLNESDNHVKFELRAVHTHTSLSP